MSLKEYQKKRLFDNTPEPSGKEGAEESPQLRFVVQKHHASHLHYDFRLEMDGVLKSWAVPKGPSINPDDKRLAMQVEDHPLAYRAFEGIIPEGNYGAGTVIVWDEGTYQADPDLDKAGNEKLLLDGLEHGKLTFVMDGEKLKGTFSLVKMKGRGENNWLLIKSDDKYAQKTDIRKQDASVKTGRTMAEVAADTGSKVWRSNRRKAKATPQKTKTVEKIDIERLLADENLNPPKGSMPREVEPMLATLVQAPFDRPDWVFEIKWDGYRAIGQVEVGREQNQVDLYSRNRKSYVQKFPKIADGLAALPYNAVLDGEIVGLDEGGRPSFNVLQNYQRNHDRIIYYVFDLLYIDGYDLRPLPLKARKKILAAILPEDHHLIRYSDHVETRGKSFYQAAEEKSVEGIMAKDGNSRYMTGIRTHSWLKIKVEKRQEFVIGGYTAPRKSRTYLGSLLIGYYDDHGDFISAGHVGTGMDEPTRKTLKEKLDSLARKTSPFKHREKANETPTWTTPKLVCEVSYNERTGENRLRHPVFVGLREDKNPKDVRLETEESTEEAIEKEEQEVREQASSPGTVKSTGKIVHAGSSKETEIETGAEITHPNRMYFPEKKLAKRDVIDYYLNMADTLLPYLKDRPIVLHRYPKGIHGESFYQKDNPQDLPDFVDSTEIHSESTGEDVKYVLCQNVDSLAYLVNLGCIEINPWNSRVRHLDNPDWLVFDLDPVDIGFGRVVETAQVIHELLVHAGIDSYCKTSGKRGLHVTIPLGGRYGNDTVKNLAEMIAGLVHRQIPDISSLERSPSKRKHKVYIDYLQNGFGKTLVAPYSLRPTPAAGVSTPLLWDEVNQTLDPQAFTTDTIFDRLNDTGDLWQPMLGPGVDLEKIMKQLDG